MHTHIIKIKKNKQTMILGNWMIDKLRERGLTFSAKDVNKNYAILIYRGKKIFDIRFNLDRIRKRLSEKLK